MCSLSSFSPLSGSLTFPLLPIFTILFFSPTSEGRLRHCGDSGLAGLYEHPTGLGRHSGGGQGLWTLSLPLPKVERPLLLAASPSLYLSSSPFTEEVLGGDTLGGKPHQAPLVLHVGRE